MNEHNVPGSEQGNAPTDEAEEKEAQRPLNLFEVMSSTLAAAFGVQSSKNLERDFKSGQLKSFIFAGVFFTAAFVVTVFLVVQLVLS